MALFEDGKIHIPKKKAEPKPVAPDVFKPQPPAVVQKIITAKKAPPTPPKATTPHYTPATPSGTILPGMTVKEGKIVTPTTAPEPTPEPTPVTIPPSPSAPTITWETKGGDIVNVETYDINRTVEDIVSKGGSVQSVVVSGHVIEPTYTPTSEPNIIQKIQQMVSGESTTDTTAQYEFIKEHTEPASRGSLIKYENLISLPGALGSAARKGYEQAIGSAYGHLSAAEKKEYGYRYTDWGAIPAEEMQYQYGGLQYIHAHKDATIDKYLKEIGGMKNVPIDPHKYASIGGIWSGKTPSDPEFLRSQAWDILSLKEREKQEKYFSILPAPARYYTAAFHGGLGMVTWPITLTQTGMKYITGSGSWKDPLGRISTGKTFFPDVAEKLQSVKPGVPGGLISVGISTGVSHFTGRKLTEWEYAMKNPIETLFGTGGEVIGLLTGDAILGGAKALTMKGFGSFRSLAGRHGLNLPSYAKISYYYPQRIIRRSWVKWGTKDIESAMGIPYHSTSTLTSKGLSYAPGKTPTSKIGWTVKKAAESRALPYTKGDILLGSSSGGRIGRIFKIKPQSLHELPALSTTPYGFAPTRFYRFGATQTSYSGVSLFPKLHLPSGFAIRISKLFKPVKGSYEKVATWATSQPKGSWGIVAPKMYLGGPETEINIFGKTLLKRYLATGSSKLLHRLKGYEYYSKVPLGEGLTEIVPIVFTKPIHYGFPQATQLLGSRIPTSIKEFFSISSSTGAKTIPILSPGHILSQIRSSYSVPSYPSFTSIPSMPSYPSKPSYPSYPSRPSYSSYPSIPSKPSYPSYPSKPSYPSYPSSASSASSASRPSYPSKPSYPFYPILSSTGKKRKPKYEIDKYATGYRFRTWKVPSMEQFLKGGIY